MAVQRVMERNGRVIQRCDEGTCNRVGLICDVASRVENRRSGCSLPVARGFSFRFVASVRFGLALFPVPAHRTGLADFPHPALGKDSRFRPRKACRSPRQAHQAKHIIERGFREPFVPRSLHLVLVAEPPTQPSADVLIDRAVGIADWA